ELIDQKMPPMNATGATTTSSTIPMISGNSPRCLRRGAWAEGTGPAGLPAELPELGPEHEPNGSDRAWAHCVPGSGCAGRPRPAGRTPRARRRRGRGAAAWPGPHRRPARLLHAWARPGYRPPRSAARERTGRQMLASRTPLSEAAHTAVPTGVASHTITMDRA